MSFQGHRHQLLGKQLIPYNVREIYFYRLYISLKVTDQNIN